MGTRERHWASLMGLLLFLVQFLYGERAHKSKHKPAQATQSHNQVSVWFHKALERSLEHFFFCWVSEQQHLSVEHPIPGLHKSQPALPRISTILSFLLHLRCTQSGVRPDRYIQSEEQRRPKTSMKAIRLKSQAGSTNSTTQLLLFTEPRDRLGLLSWHKAPLYLR